MLEQYIRAIIVLKPPFRVRLFSLFFLIHIVTARLLRMIRRNPTLIPMSDADVQDVRDMVALETVLSKEGSGGDTNVQQQLLSDLKAKRLGLKPGVFTA